MHSSKHIYLYFFLATADWWFLLRQTIWRIHLDKNAWQKIAWCLYNLIICVYSFHTHRIGVYFTARNGTMGVPVTIIMAMFLHLNYIYGTYVFEKDVSQMTGVGTAKKWLVFMEIQIKRCMGIQQVTHYSWTDLVGRIRCLVIRPEPQNQCYAYHRGIEIRCHNRYRMSILRSPIPELERNQCRPTDSLIFHIFVHGMFNINATFLHFLIMDEFGMYQPQNDCSESPGYFTVDNNGTSSEYCGMHYPWSMYFNKNVVSLKLNTNYIMLPEQVHIVLEVGVVDRHIFHDQHGFHAGIMKWIGFNIRWYLITVEMLYRVAIRAGAAYKGKPSLIIYDGPNENMPKLLSRKYLNETILSSTFQVFVVCVSTNDTRPPTLVFNAIKDKQIILKPSHQIFSRNNSGCGIRNTKTWMCTYHILSPVGTHASVNILSLDIVGPFKNMFVSAGVAIYNVINQNRSLVAHWHRGVDPGDAQLVITSTENELYMVMFSYSPFAVLSYNFSIDSNMCVGRFIGKFLRPSLPSIPDCQRPPFGLIREECLIKFDVSRECLVIQIIYLPIEYPVLQLLIHILLAYKGALHIVQYYVGTYPSCTIYGEYYIIQQSSLGISRFEIIGIVDEILCRLTSSSTMNIITVHPYDCVLPCHTVNIPSISVSGDHEFCDICTYTWFHRGRPYSVNYLPSYGSISLERIYGNRSSLHFCFDSAASVCCTLQRFCYFSIDTTFQFSEKRMVTGKIYAADVWRTQRVAKPTYDSSYNCYTNCSFPTDNPVLFRFGAYEYIAKKVKWHGSKKMQNWTSSSYECRQIGAQLLTVFDRRELNFIVQSIMAPFAVEHIFIGMQRQVCNMMTSSNGNIFRVTGHLCGEFIGPRWIPRTNASDADLWCFLWSAPE